MRVVLADLRGQDGYVSKDSVAGGYASRVTPFSRVIRVVTFFKERFITVPSGQLAYVAAIFAERRHEVIFVEDEDDTPDADIAIVLTSLVDYRREARWADAMRARGTYVGAIGLTASKMPELYDGWVDFVVNGEPEHAARRLAGGERLAGRVVSPAVEHLDELPFPRWDLVGMHPQQRGFRIIRPAGRGFPLIASRGCPEFCTYCPHRILAGYRARSVENVGEELALLCERYPNPYVIFRDPLFTQERERMLALCDEIRSRGLELEFECETRLDRLDPDLLNRLRRAGLRSISFGVESVSSETLRRVGRRPTPPSHQRAIVDHCRRRGIFTAGFYVIGFLQDDWHSVAATIHYAIDLGSTFAQFKILTPYPGTPLWKQLEPRVYERDWQRFDGFTPTFHHPSLRAEELRFLLGAAYTRFYMRPSFAVNFSRVQDQRARNFARHMDRRVAALHGRQEEVRMRPVVC
ncbi:MAG TPA: radical SAM protein [Vicinamibacterales bacterium]|nr:radical SAM protein [Vicinamibacterales bacterium]